MMIILDLEATLVDNANSGVPRPGLYSFIEFCMESFDRVALLTTVEESDARDVLYSLADSGHIPEEFTKVEYINWEGQYKDLRFVKDEKLERMLFVDDDEGWILPEQKKQWLSIQAWHGDSHDKELSRVQKEIAERIG